MTSAESLLSSLSALVACWLAPRNAVESCPPRVLASPALPALVALSALKLVAVPTEVLTVKGDYSLPGEWGGRRSVPVPAYVALVAYARSREVHPPNELVLETSLARARKGWDSQRGVTKERLARGDGNSKGARVNLEKAGPRKGRAMGRIEHTLVDRGRSSTPSDLRPPPATTSYHNKVTNVSSHPHAGTP